jgi:hypothetical protein
MIRLRVSNRGATLQGSFSLFVHLLPQHFQFLHDLIEFAINTENRKER